jgi:hypothetical protein
MESLPTALLDELARVYAQAAVDAFLAVAKETEPSTSENSDSSPSETGEAAVGGPG